MARHYLLFARRLGYRASMFNLVFATNTHSVQLWDSLGFRRLAVTPGAGKLRGIDGYVDAIQYWYDLTAGDEASLLGVP